MNKVLLIVIGMLLFGLAHAEEKLDSKVAYKLDKVISGLNSAETSLMVS